MQWIGADVTHGHVEWSGMAGQCGRANSTVKVSRQLISSYAARMPPLREISTDVD